MKTIEIEVPFSGFYESHHDQMLEDAIQQHFSYDYDKDEDKELGEDYDEARWNADINWQEIQEAYAKEYTEMFGQEFDLDLKFVQMTSPKFYNFGTDRIFAEVPKEQIDNIFKEVIKHPEWAAYIKERFTSYSGFSSNYSNDINDDDWKLSDFALDECQYRVILEFWIEKISHAHEDWELYLMDDARGNGVIDDIVDDAITAIQAEMDKPNEQ